MHTLDKDDQGELTTKNRPSTPEALHAHTQQQVQSIVSMNDVAKIDTLIHESQRIDTTMLSAIENLKLLIQNGFSPSNPILLSHFPTIGKWEWENNLRYLFRTASSIEGITWNTPIHLEKKDATHINLWLGQPTEIVRVNMRTNSVCFTAKGISLCFIAYQEIFRSLLKDIAKYDPEISKKLQVICDAHIQSLPIYQEKKQKIDDLAYLITSHNFQAVKNWTIDRKRLQNSDFYFLHQWHAWSLQPASINFSHPRENPYHSSFLHLINIKDDYLKNMPWGIYHQLCEVLDRAEKNPYFRVTVPYVKRGRESTDASYQEFITHLRILGNDGIMKNIEVFYGILSLINGYITTSDILRWWDTQKLKSLFEELLRISEGQLETMKQKMSTTQASWAEYSPEKDVHTQRQFFVWLQKLLTTTQELYPTTSAHPEIFLSYAIDDLKKFIRKYRSQILEKPDK